MLDFLKSENMKLKANNTGLEKKVTDLTDKLLKTYNESGERITSLLKSFPKPSSCGFSICYLFLISSGSDNDWLSFGFLQDFYHFDCYDYA